MEFKADKIKAKDYIHGGKMSWGEATTQAQKELDAEARAANSDPVEERLNLANQEVSELKKRVDAAKKAVDVAQKSLQTAESWAKDEDKHQEQINKANAERAAAEKAAAEKAKEAEEDANRPKEILAQVKEQLGGANRLAGVSKEKFFKTTMSNIIHAGGEDYNVHEGETQEQYAKRVEKQKAHHQKIISAARQAADIFGAEDHGIKKEPLVLNGRTFKTEEEKNQYISNIKNSYQKSVALAAGRGTWGGGSTWGGTGAVRDLQKRLSMPGTSGAPILEKQSKAGKIAEMDDARRAVSKFLDKHDTESDLVSYNNSTENDVTVSPPFRTESDLVSYNNSTENDVTVSPPFRKSAPVLASVAATSAAPEAAKADAQRYQAPVMQKNVEVVSPNQQPGVDAFHAAASNPSAGGDAVATVIVKLDKGLNATIEKASNLNVVIESASSTSRGGP
jgi:hypothetical protein